MMFPVELPCYPHLIHKRTAAHFPHFGNGSRGFELWHTDSTDPTPCNCYTTLFQLLDTPQLEHRSTASVAAYISVTHCTVRIDSTVGSFHCLHLEWKTALERRERKVRGKNSSYSSAHRAAGILLKCGFWFGRSGARPERLHFQQAHRQCWTSVGHLE